MAPLTINSTAKLLSGYEMPRLGFGVYQTPPKDTARCVAEAFQAGCRHVDSAAHYRNEGACGEAIRAASSIPRSQIFFTSKVPPQKMGYEGTKAQVDDSLAKSGLGYIDLMLLHSPYGGSAKRKGSWKALVEAAEAGKVRSIGVSNYGVHHLDELEQHIAELEEERGGKGKGGVISVGQWEVHPYCARRDIVEWCAKRHVAVEAYCPLVQGQRWGEPATKKLAVKYQKSEAQILIRWSLEKGFIPLPKSVTSARIRENVEVYDFELTPEEVQALETDEYTPVSWDPTVAALEE
ncbi:NADP-dependent oxidoreductase domain-containing protein [Chaetomidium leptoderma]|uniref:NADP-dependent oxidoreductase domain-containing protein n=1 Tax=Chaetomidium leptoderma TaxID=669021 RepID=A0AAN6VHE9_9PEZI|nr:NADP-dependent oxidoreductase domain-containing protein [Chaetomidium leptoderma]